MRFGVYLNKELIKDYGDILVAYKDAIYLTVTMGVPYEVKIIEEEAEAE
ncbi:hypothetical protein [Bacillus thuringiensis]|nr:hypothetical protein [Bacillus thuringiensis]PGT89802.1 hypothetical protein COD17_08615 [Bacillus thuringiensis]